MPDIVHGQLIKLSDNIHRITAPNPGVMTGEGTNTYLLGKQDIAIVDPGPLLDEHIDAILKGAQQLGGAIRYIVVTHTHMDHSPAAAPLAKLTGAKMIGKTPDDHQFQDETFVPDIELYHDYQLEGESFNLRAIHTPGHVSNHFCLLEQNQQMLFTGDHIMSGSTVVVVPPSGDMAAYIASLQLLLDYPIKHLGPAHGDIIEQPKQLIRHLIEHRLKREAKVLKALKTLGASNIDKLVTDVYDDVDEQMHGVAYFSLWAHLEKLAVENKVSHYNDTWQLC